MIYNLIITGTKVYKKRMRFFLKWQIHCLYKYKIIAGERFERTRRRSNKPGNSQAEGL